MSTEEPLGYLTVRIPVYAVTESESWEIPQEYTYLGPGDAELVSHDIPASWHEELRDEISEFEITLDAWTAEEIAAKCSRTPEAPAPVAADTPGLFASLTKGIPA